MIKDGIEKYMARRFSTIRLDKDSDTVIKAGGIQFADDDIMVDY